MSSGSSAGKAVGGVLALAVVGIIITLTLYALKSKIGLDDWNVDFLNGFEDWVQQFFPVTAAEGEDVHGTAFFDADGNKCVLGDSTTLYILCMPSQWKAIKLYNSENARFYIAGDDDGERSFTITKHTGQADIKTLVDALVEDGDFDETTMALAVEITDMEVFAPKKGYVRVYGDQQRYATVLSSDFLDIARKTDLEHGACPDGKTCIMYPMVNYKDVGDNLQDNGSPKPVTSVNAMGAFSYEWVKGDDSNPRSVVGIEKYLGENDTSAYAREFDHDNDGNDFAGHAISAGDRRGALGDNTDAAQANKYTKAIYNSFKTEDDENALTEYSCRYGYKMDTSGVEGSWTVDKDTNWPGCFPSSE